MTDPTREKPHRLKLEDVKQTIMRSTRGTVFMHSQAIRDIEKSYREYDEAYTAFVDRNNDDTMINLIGKYARFTRELNEKAVYYERG